MHWRDRHAPRFDFRCGRLVPFTDGCCPLLATTMRPRSRLVREWPAERRTAPQDAAFTLKEWFWAMICGADYLAHWVSRLELIRVKISGNVRGVKK